MYVLVCVYLICIYIRSYVKDIIYHIRSYVIYYVYVYICIYMYMVCVYIYTYVCVYIYIYVYTCVNAQTQIHWKNHRELLRGKLNSLIVTVVGVNTILSSFEVPVAGLEALRVHATGRRTGCPRAVVVRSRSGLFCQQFWLI
jgi:hypothetical protein